MEQNLGPGSVFKINGKVYEYTGFSSGDPQKVIAKVNPDEISSERGELHTVFTPQQLEQEAVRVGPFCELYPYSNYVSEIAAWRNLSKDVKIPFPPQALVDTLKNAKENGWSSMEAHFLPNIELIHNGLRIGREAVVLPKGWEKLEENLFLMSLIQNAPGVLTNTGGWYIIDTTPKSANPTWVEQPYPNDPFGEIIENLQANGNISNGHPGSRSKLSWNEINEHIFPEIKRKLDTSGQVRFPRITEFNVIGNLFYPEWRGKSGGEWFQDTLGSQKGAGGFLSLGHFITIPPSDSAAGVAFRPIVAFDQVDSSMRRRI